MDLCLLLLLLAFSPSRADALYPFKLVHNASHAIPLGPDEWAEEFDCKLNDETNQTRPLECRRDRNAWIYKHIDELQGDFKFLVRQDSIDARLADSAYLTNGHTGLDLHHYKFNSGDPERDRSNLMLAGGPEVNDTKCAQHLKQMLALLEGLGTTVNTMRSANGSYTRLNEAHFRLARVLDSFGRYESGQLGGRYHSFGLYEQCIGTPLLLGDRHDELVGSRSCWARLNLDRHLSRPLRNAPRGNSSFITGYFPGDFKFHLAVCLPKTCHSAAFEEPYRDNLRVLQQLVDSQFKMPESLYIEKSLPVDSVFCLVDGDSKLAQLPTGGKLFFGFVLLWTGLCIVATYKRRTKHKFRLDDARQGESRPSLWSHFDLFDSWCEFLGERELARHGDRVNLDPLNFIKCFCTIMVVAAHASVLAGPLALAHVRLSAFMETSRLESLSLFGFVLVDSFFVITAMMMAYIFLKRAAAYERRELQKLDGKLPPTIVNLRTSKIRAKRPPNFERAFSPLGGMFHRACTLLTLSRYLRLVPLFFLVFWFNKTVYPYLGSGPMWDYGLNKDTIVGGCLRETWLVPFSFLSAYLPAAQQCLPQTWTISNDLFFALIMPPIIVLLFKWPKSAFALSGLNLAVSLYLGRITYLGLDERARFEIEQLRDHSVVLLFQLASYIYTLPLYRMPAILVGTLTGYVLFRYSQTSESASQKPPSGGTSQAASRTLAVRDKRWPWWFRVPLTYACSLLVGLVFAMSLLAPEFRQFASPDLKRSMVMYMLLYYHLIWSLANAVLFLRLVTDLNNHFIIRLLASKFFSSAGKLSYAVLLIHWNFLMFNIHNQTQGVEFTRWNYFSDMSLAYLATLPIAIVIFVVFENPMDKLTKAFLPRV